MNHANRSIDYSHRTNGFGREMCRKTTMINDAVDRQWDVREAMQDMENKLRLIRYEKRKCNS